MADAFLALAGLSTLAMVFFVPFPAEARAVLALAIPAAVCHARWWLRRAGALKLDETRSVWVRDRHGRWRPGVVSHGSFVAPWLTVLHWRAQGARFDSTVVILPDMAPREALRRIRVLLRWA